MSDTQWLTPDQQRAWRAYLEATTLLFDALDRQLQADAGMPHGYYEILVRLSEEPGRAMRMSELAARTLSSRSRLSHAIARLEERGWVRRTNAPTDRRGQVAELTEQGLVVLAAAAPGHVGEVQARVISRLTPEQVGQLESIGQAIVDGLAEDG
ncbi:MAG: MarR family transcriptional regulator [Jatrophihabitantaceae bacterium]